MDNFETLDDVRAWVKAQVDDGREFILLKAQGLRVELKEIAEAPPLKELPKFINTELEASQALLKHRLNGEPLDYSALLQLMYDTNWDAEDYKQIGDNDGSLITLCDLANKLGMTAEAERAMEAVYAYD